MKIIKLPFQGLLTIALLFTVLMPTITVSKAQKKWTLGIYIAARNDLYPFSKMNIRQLAEHGSTEYLNIVVQYAEPKKQGVQRLYIEKNNPVIVCYDDRKIDSGDPHTLIEFAQFLVEHYPAEHYALDLWDHGVGGSLDPYLARTLELEDLACFNPAIDFITPPPSGFNLIEEHQENRHHRGICFDEMYHSYLNNQALEYAFSTIHTNVFKGKKWDIVGCDACLMSDIAFYSIIKKYAHFGVASQNVEPGSGWRYNEVIAPFMNQALEPVHFAQHIVAAYKQVYESLSGGYGYTLSALDLSSMELFEKMIHEISLLLIECLRFQKDKTVKDAISVSRSPRVCITFDEESYIDAKNFLSNIQMNLKLFQFTNHKQGHLLQTMLYQKISDALTILNEMVIANWTDPIYRQAGGLSIYFPSPRNPHPHSSFGKTTFANANAWYLFLKQYLMP
jgi:hypothetical protein